MHLAVPRPLLPHENIGEIRGIAKTDRQNGKYQ
jgi:hypothetical protein